MLVPAGAMHFYKKPKLRVEGQNQKSREPRKTSQQSQSRPAQETAKPASKNASLPTVRFNQAINAAVKLGDRARAEQIFEEMKVAGTKADEITFNSLIHACAKEGDMAG